MPSSFPPQSTAIHPLLLSLSLSLSPSRFPAFPPSRLPAFPLDLLPFAHPPPAPPPHPLTRRSRFSSLHSHPRTHFRSRQIHDWPWARKYGGLRRARRYQFSMLDGSAKPAREVRHPTRRNRPSRSRHRDHGGQIQSCQDNVDAAFQRERSVRGAHRPNCSRVLEGTLLLQSPAHTNGENEAP